MRNKKDFIEALKHELRLLNVSEREELISFYEDRFENARFEGKNESDIIKELESPTQIAANVYEQYGINPAVIDQTPRKTSLIGGLAKVILVDLFVASWAIPVLYAVTFGLAVSLLSFPLIFSGMGSYSTVAIMLNLIFSFASYFIIFVIVIYLFDVTVSFTCWILEMHVRLVNDQAADRVANFPKEHKLRNYLRTTQWKLKLLVPIAILSLVVSPAIYFTNGHSQSGWFGTPSKADIVEKTLSFESTFDTILNFDVVNTDITYRVGNVDKIQIDLVYYEGNELIVNENNHEIKIYSQGQHFSFNPYSLFAFDKLSKSSTIVVTVPEAALLKSVNLNSVSGRIEVTNLISAESSFETVSGNIKLKTSNSGDIKISSVSGSISLDDIKTDKILVETVSGNVNLNKCGSVTNGVRVETVSGDTIIRELFNSNVNIDSVSGDATYYIVDQSRKSNINFDSVSGKLSFE